MLDYTIRDTDDIITPALIYYKDGLLENAARAIRMAGGADRLWPHVKTHKSMDMVHMLMKLGIRRFKCAQIAELEMVCRAGADAAILSMPPAGPTARRAAALVRAFPDTALYFIAECREHIGDYARAAAEAGVSFRLLMDVNFDMDRTGAPLSKAEELFAFAAEQEGVEFLGFHCYDGNRHEEIGKRQKIVDKADAAVFRMRDRLVSCGFRPEVIVFGGSPSFPCHVKYQGEGIWYSPGTIMIFDKNYSTAFPDLDFVHAAAIMSRVISRPAEGLFTLDCGYKGISGDPPMEKRAYIAGFGHCRPVLQNEEHLVFKMDPGYEAKTPAVGTVFYLIPGHICPCALLYPEILIAENGEIIDHWETTARDRRITW